MDADLISYESMIAAKETARWTFWIMWATWFAGVATFGAVVLSLWLARRGEKIDIKCSVGIKDLIVKNALGISIKSGVAIEITNATRFPVTISNIGWDCGKGLFLHQQFGDKESDVIPKKLDYGERCFLWIELTQTDNWFEQVANSLIKNKKTRKIGKIRLLVSTTTTKPFKVKPDDNLLKQMSETIENIENKQ